MTVRRSQEKQTHAKRGRNPEIEIKTVKTWILLFALLILVATTVTVSCEGASKMVCVANVPSKSAKSPSLEWSGTYGGTGNQWANSLVQTSDGGYAMAGWTESSGAGPVDFWFVKVNAAGGMLWNHTYGEAKDQFAFSLIQTSDGDYALAGYTDSFGAGKDKFWLVKTDPNGNMIWNKTYGGANDDYGVSVVQTSDGGYAMAGWTNSSGVGVINAWLVKTDALGNMIWNKTYGGAGDNYAVSVVQTSDKGYVLAGFTDSFGAGGYDFWLVKTDASGNMQWNQTYGGTGNDRGECVKQTSDGGYAIAGSTSSFGAGNDDFWLVKTDPDGNMIWNKTYGGSGDDEAYSMIQTSDGGYALAGYTDSFGAGNDDFWLVKTDAPGNMQWNQTYGGTAYSEAYCVIQTSDGGYALAGYTDSFGNSGHKFYLVKTLSANPTASPIPSFTLNTPLIVTSVALTIIIASVAVIILKRLRARKLTSRHLFPAHLKFGSL